MWRPLPRSSVTAAVISLALFALLVDVVESKECSVKKGLRAWKHNAGMFIREGKSTVWHELDGNGKRVASFLEKSQQDGQVVLYDAGRELHLLLRSDLAALQQKGEQNFHQLYTGKFLTTMDCT